MILPDPSPDTEAYWEAAREQRFLLRYCDACNKWFHPRQTHCVCGQMTSWRESRGVGRLMAHTVVHYELNPGMKGMTPYTITLTRLDEGPQVLTSLPGEMIGLVAGMAMQATYDAVIPEVTLPRFSPASTVS
jgi:uncharacterized OB-fold protein